MKKIKTFRQKDYGLFIDLEDRDAAIAVDTESGEILLDEGEGQDRYHGAAVSVKAFKNICIAESAEGTHEIILKFSKISHSLGQTTKQQPALEWINKVNETISAIKIEDAKKYQELGVKLIAIHQFRQALKELRSAVGLLAESHDKPFLSKISCQAAQVAFECQEYADAAELIHVCRRGSFENVETELKALEKQLDNLYPHKIKEKNYRANLIPLKNKDLVYFCPCLAI